MILMVADIPLIEPSMPWEALVRLLLAATLGAAIGVEREHHGRSAGLRTQILVSVGGAIVMLLSLHFGEMFSRLQNFPSVRVDPSRAISAVMTGIGFLGAGVIIRRRGATRGLTTAASLWCNAAIGMTCGLGVYTIAFVATGVVLFTLFFLTRLDKLIPTRYYRSLRVVLPAAEGNLERLTEALRLHGAHCQRVDYERSFAKNLESFHLHVRMSSSVELSELLKIKHDLPQIMHLRIY